MSIKNLDDKVSAVTIVACIAYLSWHIYSAVEAGRLIIKFW